MTFDEYVKNGRKRYEGLIDAVQTILDAAMRQNDLVPHGIKGRAKDPDSLAKKLEDRKIDPTSAIDSVLKDLAGVRIVFLTNGQVDQFNRAGILRENFEVLNVNEHHPVPGTETEGRLFDSTNYMVALKPERLALPEYAAFAGMRCEIQVQTLLNHAWAEMDHDAFYKQPDIGRMGEKQLKAIKRRMDNVMRNHLIPAGHDFDQISGEMRRLIEADGSFEATFETLAKANDNGTIAGALGGLTDLILPQVDEPAQLFLKHLPDLIGVVERTRGSLSVQNETPYGNYAGPNGEDIARKVAQLVRDFRYADPSATLDALVRFYSGAASETERKIWVDAGGEFAANNLNIWQKYGPTIARIVLDAVGKLDGKALGAAKGLIVAMLAKILSADMQGMSVQADTVTIQQGVVPVSDAVIAIRCEAIGLLENFLDTAPDDAGRRVVLAALRAAGQHPFNGGTAEVAILVRRDAANVLRIEAARVGAWGHELRRQSEANALHVHHRFSALPEFLAASEAAVAAQAEVLDAIAALRAAIAGDPEFELYKLMAGRDSARPAAWDGDRFDYRETGAWRTASFAELVGTIDDDAVDEWIERARRIIAEARTDDAVLFPLGDFFRLVAKEKPKVAWAFLEAMDDDLAVILRSLLHGLEDGGDRTRIEYYAARWMSEGRFLGTIGAYLRSAADGAVELLEKLSARSVELGDEVGILSVIDAATRQYDRTADRRLIDNVFMPAIGHLADNGKDDWVHFAWGSEGKLVAALDEAEAQRLLSSFIGVPEVGYEEDRILAIVAAKYSGLVFDFFETRIRRGRGEAGHRFSPIPFGLHELRDALAPHPELLIAAARRWHERDPVLHEFEGGRLFHNIYPEFPDDVVARLRALVADGGPRDVEFVLGLLNGYEGSDEIYPLCMDIVEALPEGDPLLRSVVRVLAQTGVLVGEFGFVAAEGAQRERVERYKEDPRPKVQTFVNDQLHRIQQSMAGEQRMASRQVAARKRQFGEE